MGIVYLGHDPVIDRQVAVKVLQTAIDDEDSHQRFRREARSAGNLTHPNIVTIYDAGEHEGQPFIAMAYIAGEPLADLIQRREIRSLRRKVELFSDLCEGLAYAHDAGVIHRDIKPANLMVDGVGRLRILDFGLARLTETTGLSRMTAAGTPSYMAPEQIGGGVVDRRADIFAAGLVFYELIGYRKAFAGDSNHQIYNRILSEDPQPLLEVAPGTHPAIVRIVETAIRKRPEDRYQTLSQLLAELADFRARLARGEIEDLEEPPVQAAPPGVGSARTPTPGTPSRLDPHVLAQRRASQIEAHVAAARAALETGDVDTALEEAENALLLNADEARARQIGVEVRRLQDARQATVHVNAGREALQRGDLTEAKSRIAQALALDPHFSAARTLADEVVAWERERQAVKERALALSRALNRARTALAASQPDAALAAAIDVLAIDPQHSEALQLQRDATAAVEAARAAQAQLDSIRAVVDGARELAAQGAYDSALRRLKSIRSSHPVAQRVYAEIEEESLDRDLAAARSALGFGSFDRVLELVDQIVERHGEVPEAALLRRQAEEALSKPPVVVVQPTAPVRAQPQKGAGASGTSNSIRSLATAKGPTVRARRARVRIYAVASSLVAIMVVVVLIWIARSTDGPPDHSLQIRALLAAADQAAVEGRDDAALAAYGQVMGLDPANAAASDSIRRLRDKVESKRREEEQRRAAELAALLDRADIAAARGRLDEAERLYRDAATQDTPNERAAAGLAQVRLARSQPAPGQRPESESHQPRSNTPPKAATLTRTEPTAQVESPDPKATEIAGLLKKADALFGAKLWDDAIEGYQKVLTLDPNNQAALEGRKKAVTAKILGGKGGQ